MIHGKDIIIRDADGNNIIAASKSCDLDLSVETIETCSTRSGSYREFIRGRKEWTISISYLVTNINESFNLFGEKVQITILDKKNDGDYLTGEAICTKCKITATTGSLVQGSFVFQGTGVLT